MTELLRDTTLGNFIRTVTHQRILPREEDRDPSVWERYVDKERSHSLARHETVDPEEEEKDVDELKDAEETNGVPKGNSNSQQTLQNTQADTGAARNSSDTRLDSQGNERYDEVSGVRVDPEKGRDNSIVTWYSENDPEVSISNLAHTRMTLIPVIEPPKLAYSKENLRHLPDMSPDIFRLHRICYLLCRYPKCRGTVWCRSSCRNTWSHVVRGWLWSWSHDLGSDVRDSNLWQKSDLHRHISCICIPAIRSHLRQELRDAACVPVLDGILWLSGSGYWRCNDGRHL